MDYVKAASGNCLPDVEINFNHEATRISPVLGDFNSYLLNRVDYCFNFDVKELNLKCSPQQMMILIKRSNIPKHFTERTKYDETSHRMKTDKNSFYLESNSVVINCYYKYYQLQKEFPDCPDIENSLNVIRFEVQCKYLKTYDMFKKMPDIKTMLSNDVCYDVTQLSHNKNSHKP